MAIPPVQLARRRSGNLLGCVNGWRAAAVVADMKPGWSARLLPIAIVILLVGCGSDSPKATALPASSGPADSSAVEVVVENYMFPPITVSPGTSIRFVDRDDEAHTVTADDATFSVGPFDSKNPGALTAPSSPGRYAFHCKIHPTMHGVIVVRQP
jgi:plastocyanin